MITIGIDVGKTGAVAAIDTEVILFPQIERLPVDENGRLRASAFADLLRKLCPEWRACVFVEQINVFRGGSIRSNAKTDGDLVRLAGAVEAVVRMLRFEYHEVAPVTWKKFYGLKSDKGASVELVRRIWPDSPLKLKKHHNDAEALLIAHWGYRKAA